MPLDKGTEDRFYSFRTPLVNSNAAHSVLTESSLYDATLNLIQEGSTSEKAKADALPELVSSQTPVRSKTVTA